jgi:lauroyl/myristoyl acyltransferase
MLALIAYLAADLAVRTLPSRAADGMARGMARLAFALRVPARRRLESNLARLMRVDATRAGPAPGTPHPRARDGSSASDAGRTKIATTPGPAAAVRSQARASFEHFALALADFLRLSRMPRPALDSAIELRGGEHLDAARASGRGVIVLSAHTGNWEWGAAYLAGRVKRVRVAARSHPSPWVDAFFARRRRRWGVMPLDGGPSWLAACRALRSGEWVAMMGDRRAPGMSGSLCGWAGALARRTGAVVLPALMLRTSAGRYAACFEAPLSPEACRDGAYREVIRRVLEREPGQWFAFEALPEGLA